MQIIMTGNGIFLIYMLLNFTFILLHFFPLKGQIYILQLLAFANFFFPYAFFNQKRDFGKVIKKKCVWYGGVCDKGAERRDQAPPPPPAGP